MKYIFLLLTVCSWSATSAQLHRQVLFEFSSGYQQENFDWSIAGNSLGENPNIYSELKWKQIAGPSLDGYIHWNVCGSFTLTTSYRISFITTGNVSDFDYLGDNRTENVYKGCFHGGKGNLQGYNIKAGYQIACSQVFELRPAVGYVVNWQRLHISDATKDVQSTYFTNWRGFSITLSAVFRLSDKMEIIDDFSVQQLKFRAKANWNLVNTFQHPLSFEDFANGAGLSNEFKFTYLVKPIISLHIAANYYYQRTAKGIDRLYLANGATAMTQFNGAKRQGFVVSSGVRITLKK